MSYGESVGGIKLLTVIIFFPPREEACIDIVESLLTEIFQWLFYLENILKTEIQGDFFPLGLPLKS